MFRLYGPTQRLFDKAWTLADVETNVRRARFMAAKKTILTCRVGGSAPHVGAQHPAPIPSRSRRIISSRRERYVHGAASSGSRSRKAAHRREPFDVKHQTVVRGNRDTLYSGLVLRSRRRTGDDNNAGCRKALHVAAWLINEDHYVTGCLFTGPAAIHSTRRWRGHALCPDWPYAP